VPYFIVIFYIPLQKNLDAMPIHGNGSTEIKNADGKLEVMGRLNRSALGHWNEIM
jgi:hypothetical protein